MPSTPGVGPAHPGPGRSLDDRSKRTWPLAVLNLVLPVGTLTALAYRLLLDDWGRLGSLHAWFTVCLVVHVVSMVTVIRGSRGAQLVLVTAGVAANILLAGLAAAAILRAPPVEPLPASAVEVPGRDVPLIDIDGGVVMMAVAAMGLAGTLAHFVLRRRRTRSRP